MLTEGSTRNPFVQICVEGVKWSSRLLKSKQNVSFFAIFLYTVIFIKKAKVLWLIKNHVYFHCIILTRWQHQVWFWKS